MMLHTKYQGPRPCGFRQEDFMCVFPYISQCKTCDPPGVCNFWPQWHDLNKFVRDSLGDATYQTSRL